MKLSNDTINMICTILGSGDVEGHPIITKPNKYIRPGENKFRPGFLVQSTKKTLVFDTNPDIRLQLIKAKVTNIDAIFITHQHFDHLWGIADIYQLSWLEEIRFKVYVNRSTLNYITTYFPWIKLPLEVIEYNKSYVFDNISVVPLRVIHSLNFETAGYLITSENNKTVLYAPDWKGFEDNPGIKLECDVAVVDGCYFFGKYIADNDEHLGREELKAIIGKLNAEKTYLMSVAPYYYKKTTDELRKLLPAKYYLPDDFDKFEI